MHEQLDSLAIINSKDTFLLEYLDFTIDFLSFFQILKESELMLTTLEGNLSALDSETSTFEAKISSLDEMILTLQSQLNVCPTCGSEKAFWTKELA